MGDAPDHTSRLQFRTHPIAWATLSPVELRQHMSVHEVGHAVVGLAHDMPVLEVDIESDPVDHPDGGFIFGGTRFDTPDGDMNAWARDRPGDSAVVLMAGLCAEEVVFGSHLRESWLGDLRILRIGHGWLEGRAEIPHEVFRYINDAHDAVTRNEASVGAVADELLRRGRLTGSEVAELTQAPG